jgi:hypothetical protein
MHSSNHQKVSKQRLYGSTYSCAGKSYDAERCAPILMYNPSSVFHVRSPISEAQIGVLTVLVRLGLRELVEKRDLVAIRKWFASQDKAAYSNHVFEVAKVKYLVMTNIPFSPQETEHWIGSVR